MTAIFSSLVSQRPEFENAMKTWSETLEPALAAREQERKATLSKARNRTITTGTIVAAVALFVLIVTGGAGFVITLILAIAVTAIASGVAWIPLLAMKSETKQLVVGSAAEAFGFKYETLHPDMGGISDWKSAGAWLKQQNSSDAAGRLFQRGSGDTEPPTPAFDVLKKAKL